MNELEDLGGEQSGPGRLLQQRRVRYALIWGAWTIVALFFSTQVYMMYYAGRQPIPYAKAVDMSFVKKAQAKIRS